KPAGGRVRRIPHQPFPDVEGGGSIRPGSVAGRASPLCAHLRRRLRRGRTHAGGQRGDRPPVEGRGGGPDRRLLRRSVAESSGPSVPRLPGWVCGNPPEGG